MPAPEGPQFVRVYHASESWAPPHIMHAPDHIQSSTFRSDTNLHPDVIHAGTSKSSSEFGRDYVHVYDIPVERQYPVVFADSYTMTFTPQTETDVVARNWPNVKQYNARMKGLQPGLFETIEGDPHLAIKSEQAVPYRNRAEDPGSISWMMPKSAIVDDDQPDKIRYIGMSDRRETDYE